MDNRDQQEPIVLEETETPGEEIEAAPVPIQDIEMFSQLRDVIRTHYLWQWDESAKDTNEFTKELKRQIQHDPQFRLVGEIDLDDHVFEITLWLEETLAYSLASVDIMMLDTLQVDFSRGAILARELTRLGLEYHLLIFGEGRAQQLHINIIGPRMQQIRDLGTLVAPSVDTFSA